MSNAGVLWTQRRRYASFDAHENDIQPIVSAKRHAIMNSNKKLRKTNLQESKDLPALPCRFQELG